MGERSGIAAIHSQLLKSHNNNTAFILIVLGFHGLLHLLRPSKRILPTKRPNAARNTYSSPQSGRATALQPVLRPMEVKWRRQLCRIAPPVKRHLDLAWQGASPLGERGRRADGNGSRRATEPCAAAEAHVEEHLVVCTPPCSTCAPPCSMCAPPLAVPPSPSGGVRALRERGERNRQCKGRDNGGAACGARECAAIASRKQAAASFTAACVAPCRLEVSNCSSARAVCAAATRREQAMERTSKRGERR